MTMSYSSGQATLSRLRAHYARLLFFMAAPYPSGQVVQARPKALILHSAFIFKAMPCPSGQAAC